jgi:hypothetical protein
MRSVWWMVAAEYIHLLHKPKTSYILYFEMEGVLSKALNHPCTVRHGVMHDAVGTFGHRSCECE